MAFYIICKGVKGECDQDIQIRLNRTGRQIGPGELRMEEEVKGNEDDKEEEKKREEGG